MEWFIGYVILVCIVTLIAGKFCAFSNLTPDDERIINDYDPNNP